MIRKQLTSLTLILLFSLTVAAKPCKKQSITDFAKAIAQAYEQRKLADLDAERPYAATFRIVIEHSLSGDDEPGRFVRRTFTSFARFERWLKTREIEGLPARQAMPFKGCAKGACTFQSDVGILHNHLYLKRITYGMRNGCPYIKTIYLLDGD
jgi:hypothetical protein